MSKRSAELLLSDIIDCIDKINQYTHNVSFNDFTGNDMLVDAVNRNFTVIGEAANRLPLEFKNKHASIDWINIISFRNRIVHEYFGVDTNITWQIITNDLIPLKQKLLNIQN